MSNRGKSTDGGSAQDGRRTLRQKTKTEYLEDWDGLNAVLWRLCKTVWILALTSFGAISAYIGWMVLLG